MLNMHAKTAFRRLAVSGVWPLTHRQVGTGRTKQHGGRRAHRCIVAAAR